MSEEDDWFERALRDLDEDADSDGDDEAGSDEPSERDEGSDEVDPGEGDDPFGGVRNADRDGGGDIGSGEPDTETGAVPDSGFDGGDEPFGGDAFGDADPFGGAAGGADRSGGEPTTDIESEGETTEYATGGDDPFGDADPFGGYRETAPSPDDAFGFAEFGGGDEPGTAGNADPAGFDIDPDEFESAIPRIDVGIEGLDEMILGGVPARSLISVIGGAGTGKTTFALQFLNEALESDGKGVYITLEQTRESILSTAAEKGWSFEDHAAEGRLAVVAIDPIEMANSLASIRNDLTRLIAEFDADRLVLDSVSLLEMMYDHPSKRRSEVFGFTRSLKEAGVTTLLTSEASQESPYASRHGIVEYLTDAVFVLQYVRGSDFRETRLAVEIQKIRDANHSRETKPYDITDTGISVYDQANIF
ncbi:KaiC domain-containing protein [Halorubrum laminariae]|uniref:KaiC domain-containing protein n=1 Tax=Halorubrum laminariae TaxID=1433523 RepID=A0ABD6C3U0_9EURY|nr:KaiC domain-containing protein [Halorubrum laminariae]